MRCPECNSTRYKKVMGIGRCMACGYVNKSRNKMLQEFENKNDNKKKKNNKPIS